VEWIITDLAILQIGAIPVPIYPTMSDQEYAYIFEHAEIKTAFVSNQALFERISAIQSNLSHIISFENIDGAIYLGKILERANETDVNILSDRKKSIKDSDLASIIYTSGTTGRPKGVMLSHRNIVSNIQAIIQLLPINNEHRVISFLPLSHIFERMVVYTYLYLGCHIHFEHDLERLMQTIKEVKPHFFATVPRLLEKVYEKMLDYGFKLKGWRRKLYFFAINMGLRYQVDIDQGWQYRLKLSLAKSMVFKRWKKQLGGELFAVVTGAVALPPQLCKVFSAAGIMVREGYGQTESSPVISFNRFEPGGTLEGSVGLPVPGVEVKIAADGEILARGPNVMMGYYKDSQATANTIDEEGWLHTGDVGKLVKGRFIVLTDRIKELFKTSGGKYVAPTPIEQKYRESPFIDQVMVVGADQKFVAALIVPNFSQLVDWGRENELSFRSLEELITLPEVIQKYETIRAESNQQFNKIEKIKKVKLLSRNWSEEMGEITSTQKLKRRIIAQNFKDDIEDIYAD
ncbi:MAG: long-chain fatty acid--CoA ligase, partial [Bacteroidetes bacterium]|nr:long-chain fatty acid--CoA ligase [Bacteroidota bacterium]